MAPTLRPRVSRPAPQGPVQAKPKRKSRRKTKGKVAVSVNPALSTVPELDSEEDEEDGPMVPRHIPAPIIIPPQSTTSASESMMTSPRSATTPRSAKPRTTNRLAGTPSRLTARRAIHLAEASSLNEARIIMALIHDCVLLFDPRGDRAAYTARIAARASNFALRFLLLSMGITTEDVVRGNYCRNDLGADEYDYHFMALGLLVNLRERLYYGTFPTGRVELYICMWWFSQRRVDDWDDAQWMGVLGLLGRTRELMLSNLTTEEETLALCADLRAFLEIAPLPQELVPPPRDLDVSMEMAPEPLTAQRELDLLLDITRAMRALMFPQQVTVDTFLDSFDNDKPAAQYDTRTTYVFYLVLSRDVLCGLIPGLSILGIGMEGAFHSYFQPMLDRMGSWQLARCETVWPRLSELLKPMRRDLSIRDREEREAKFREQFAAMPMCIQALLSAFTSGSLLLPAEGM